MAELSYPDNLKYTKDHEWVRLEDDGTAVVGITDFAQHELGDVVYLELPDPGSDVEAHTVLGTVESVKAVSDIFAPVAGEVVLRNEALLDSPETLNSDPYGAGWLVKIKLADPAIPETLMSANDYQGYIKETD